MLIIEIVSNPYSNDCIPLVRLYFQTELDYTGRIEDTGNFVLITLKELDCLLMYNFNINLGMYTPEPIVESK